MLSEILRDLKEFRKISDRNFVFFFEPPSIDDRIVNQFAFFSVMSGIDQTMDRWLRHYPGLWRRIIIPAELKWEVRDKLDQANITERVLFPGLDGLGKWLRRHYSPKEPPGGDFFQERKPA